MNAIYSNSNVKIKNCPGDGNSLFYILFLKTGKMS